MKKAPTEPGQARGLYETLITQALAERLRVLDPREHVHRVGLQSADAADRIALHLGRLIARVIDSLPEDTRVERGVALARQIVGLLDTQIGDIDAIDESPIEPGEVLRAVVGRLPDGTPEAVPLPSTPLLDTILLTNAPEETRVGRQLETEIHSADRIDLLMAFIRRSGVRLLLPALRRYCEAGGALRVMTTTYTGSTEALALDQLSDLGAEVRVSYDTSMTRLHAKAWLFHRRSGFSTAYIGSSNLTHAAHTGLEWNVRVSGARNPDVIDQGHRGVRKLLEQRRLRSL
jgi:HKD family nuclease